MAQSVELEMLLDAYDGGEIDALKAYAELKDFEEQLTKIIEYIKPKALDALDRYGNNTVAFGYLWQKVANVEYDYFHIDPIREGEEKIKEIKDLVNRLKKEAQRGSIKDATTGVEYPPAKRIDNGYKLIAKKVNS